MCKDYKIINEFLTYSYDNKHHKLTHEELVSIVKTQSKLITELQRQLSDSLPNGLGDK